MGPFQVNSSGGHKYAVSLIDHATGYGDIFPVPKKSDASRKLMMAIYQWQTQSGYKVKRFRTDRGTEYLAEFEEFLALEGIVHETSAAYTPEQNGIAERYNRTLLEKVRCKLREFQLYPKLWGEAIVSAAGDTNLIPRSGEKMTPFEQLLGRKPVIDHLKVFGCWACVYIPTHKRGKLEPTAEHGILVGYAPYRKAWRILILRNNKLTVVESANVHFDEQTTYHLPGVSPYPASRDSSGGVSKRDTGAHWDPTAGVICEGFPDATEVVPWEIAMEETPQNQLRTPSPAASEVGDTEQDQPSAEPPHEHSDAAAQGTDDASEGMRMSDGDPWSLSEHSGTDWNADGVPHGGAEPGGADPDVEDDRRYPDRQRHKPDRFQPAMQVQPGKGTFDHPRSMAEALSRPDGHLWAQGLNKEMMSQFEKHVYAVVWDVDSIPSNAKILPTKYICNLKRDQFENIIEQKVRWVVCGNRQRAGEDYSHIYAPVPGSDSFRVLVSISAQQRLYMHQLDVSTAFLNAPLKEEVYVQLPKVVTNGQRVVVKLRKALYGLCQSPQAWSEDWGRAMHDLGFAPSPAGP